MTTKPRKTYPVQDLVAKINRRLDSHTTSQESRSELANLLASILHETGNYHGFGYLPEEYAEEPPFHPGTTHLRPGYDDTRRVYYQR